MVRALTSYSDASSRALRRRGAQARSSSTSAYSRSVRFTFPTVGPATDKPGWIRPFMTPLPRWAGGELRGTNAQIEFLPRHALADAARLA